MAKVLYSLIVQGSDDGVLYLEELRLDLVHRLMFLKTQRFGNWICFHLQVK
jgi:hypothetical protein